MGSNSTFLRSLHALPRMTSSRRLLEIPYFYADQCFSSGFLWPSHISESTFCLFKPIGLFIELVIRTIHPPWKTASLMFVFPLHRGHHP